MPRKKNTGDNNDGNEAGRGKNAGAGKASGSSKKVDLTFFPANHSGRYINDSTRWVCDDCQSEMSADRNTVRWHDIKNHQRGSVYSRDKARGPAIGCSHSGCESRLTNYLSYEQHNRRKHNFRGPTKDLRAEFAAKRQAASAAAAVVDDQEESENNLYADYEYEGDSNENFWFDYNPDDDEPGAGAGATGAGAGGNASWGTAQNPTILA